MVYQPDPVFTKAVTDIRLHFLTKAQRHSALVALLVSPSVSGAARINLQQQEKSAGQCLIGMLVSLEKLLKFLDDQICGDGTLSLPDELVSDHGSSQSKAAYTNGRIDSCISLINNMLAQCKDQTDSV